MRRHWDRTPGVPVHTSPDPGLEPRQNAPTRSGLVSEGWL